MHGKTWKRSSSGNRCGAGRRCKNASVLIGIALPAVLTLLAGCQQQMPGNVIELTRQSSEDGPARLHWQASRVLFVPNSRGQVRLLAEHETPATSQPVRQWLTVRVLWEVNPTQSGTDPSALNAVIGYLVRTDPQSGPSAMLYYEGSGNVLTEQGGWWTGGTEFTIRHAFLRLSRSNRTRSVDPLGTVEVSGRLVAGADADAASAIESVEQMVGELPPPADDPPATMPDAP
jgi:hypothetical protein